MAGIHCRHCRAINESAARFCRDCGANLRSPAETGAGLPSVTLSERTITADAQTGEQARVTGVIPGPGLATETAGENEESAAARAARELARASGLGDQLQYASWRRAVIASLALLLTFAAWLVYRDQSQASAPATRTGVNLIAPDEASQTALQLGERHRLDGNYEMAIEKFQEALKLTPGNTQAAYLMGRSLIANGQSEKAIDIFREMLAKDPKHLQARLFLADIYQERGLWTLAIREYRRIMDQDPNSEQAQLALAALEKIVIDRPDPDAPVAANPHRRPERAAMVREFPVGRSASPVIVHESGVSSNATPDLTRIIRQADEEADPEQSRRNLGTILKNQGMRLNNAGNHFEAIRRLQKAGAYTPEDKDLNYLIGQAFHKAGQPAVAVEYYRKVDSGQYVGVARNAVKRAEEQARKMAQKQAKPRY